MQNKVVEWTEIFADTLTLSTSIFFFSFWSTGKQKQNGTSSSMICLRLDKQLRNRLPFHSFHSHCRCWSFSCARTHAWWPSFNFTRSPFPLFISFFILRGTRRSEPVDTTTHPTRGHLFFMFACSMGRYNSQKNAIWRAVLFRAVECSTNKKK